MAQLDRLRAEFELAATARGQEDLAHWNLGRQTQRIGSRSAIADNGFAVLAGPLLDHLGDLWCPRSELALHWQDIDTTSGSQQLAVASQARQRLIHRSPAAEM